MDTITFSDYNEEYIAIEKLNENSYRLTLAKDVILQPNASFFHDTKIIIEKIDKDIELFFVSGTEKITTYIFMIEELKFDINDLCLEMYNITNQEIFLREGLEFGYIWVTKPYSKTLPTPSGIPYYDAEGIKIFQETPDLIEKFTYIIDETGKHKLQLDLNKPLYEGEGPLSFPLK